MSINERIKLLRKELGLNQKEFALQLGITQSGVSYMEQPGSTVADSTIKTICLTCNLNENWLRYGELPKIIESKSFSLDKFVDQRKATDEEKEMLKEIMQIYFDFDPDVRKALLSTYMNKIHPEQKQKDLFEGLPSEVEAYKMYKSNKKDKNIGSNNG